MTRSVLSLVTTATLAAAALPALSPAQAASSLSGQSGPRQAATRLAEAGDRMIAYRQWTTGRQLARGQLAGVKQVSGSLRIARPVSTRRYDDPHGKPTKRYDVGHWTSPWTSPGFGFNELIASWDATTPRDTWIEVQVRGRSEDGRRSSWDTLGRWAQGDARFFRTSVPRQGDDIATVATDTWRTQYSLEMVSYQLRVKLMRRTGTRATPVVDTIGAMASNLPSYTDVRTSRTGMRSRRVLDVPRYSQMIHRGDYPQYGNGGEAWCSPTSTSMVLGYYKRLPAPEQYAWVKQSHPNRFVDHAARMVYDYEYDGAGNWPFNTAYAANHADSGFVTRLRSLREAERFIRAGIPVVASISFGPGELTGAPIRSTAGHLLVIVGFEANGDVIANDPAAARNKGVRRTYDRGQFEDAWLPKSGGLSYIIRTADRPLPARNGVQNW
jgi:hypothetical protein